MLDNDLPADENFEFKLSNESILNQHENDTEPVHVKQRMEIANWFTKMI